MPRAWSARMRSARSSGRVPDRHRPVVIAGELLAEVDQRLELVGLEHGVLVLQDRRQAVETEAGVDVAGRQRLQLVVGVLVVLHEHEVPVLQEPLVLAAGQVVGRTEGRGRGRCTAPSTAHWDRPGRLPRSSPSGDTRRSARAGRRRRATARSPPRRGRARAPRRRRTPSPRCRRGRRRTTSSDSSHAKRIASALK